MKGSTMIKILYTVIFLFLAMNSLAIAQIYHDSSNRVGIGTASPSQKLDVVGGSINIEQNQAYKANNNWLIGQLPGSNTIQIGSTAINNDILFTSTYQSTGLAVIKYDGRVGIGTIYPNANLDVIGPIRNRLQSTGNDSGISFNPGTNAPSIAFNASNGSTTFTLNTNVGSTWGNNFLKFDTPIASNIFVLRDNGSVGIGTLTPSTKLDVAGGAIINRCQSTGDYSGVSLNPTSNAPSIGFNASDNSRRFTISLYRGSSYVDDLLKFQPYSYPSFILKGDGKVGIKRTPGTYSLEVDGSGVAYNWYIWSDSKLKKDIMTIGGGALDKVSALRGVEFKWRTEEFPDKGFDKGKKIGLIAEEVEKVMPESVSTDNEGYKSIDYASVVGVLVEAVKELKTHCGSLKTENEELRARIEALEKSRP